MLDLPSDYAYNKAVIARCFSEFSLEDDVKDCIAALQDDRSLMEDYHAAGNTKCQWHQPCEEYVVIGP
ncbi:hypothetical protein GUITHDRAFT_111746 [Guillardia theta CCMP2712]|uniref:Uncharacterized protein n=1 Tax=Guillardia theta (strain CCMP2712) TaxID=905079 RepID=L1J260_GUITC|nr:hypothetical protein GUITHDRAFT_111746 [Guillardia theta CCMP2712]EKX42180.1 hypothetical protein GUITHDRAFT_111746 [Guillardia theta CCMP2712]|eukprot:XP_005829160.1 hypothetical protein GUITHDRAFT_111746 [Guillardia theta CCMP2712]